VEVASGTAGDDGCVGFICELHNCDDICGGAGRNDYFGDTSKEWCGISAIGL
jgi:hypothetical protein